MRTRMLLAALAVVLGVCVRTAPATLLLPMSDEDLVASSDLIATGTVTRIASRLLEGRRVVTTITLAVEGTLKGDVPGGELVLTEPGGRVAGLVVGTLGAPAYAAGERVLVFGRVRADGTVSTNGLSLGKYTIADDADAAPRARRSGPAADVRPLHAFTGRIALLAATTVGARTDGRAGAAVVPADIEAVTGAFNFATSQGVPSRWFEADCGLPVTFVRAGADAAQGEAASQAAVEGAATAWTAVDGASLTLAIGALTSPTPSLVGGTFDGQSVIQFEDPFGEVEELTGCTGVLARGGFVASSDPAFPELRRTVGGTDFGKIFEGDVVMNNGLGACFPDASLLAEVATHEVGHAIGFAHASENPAEPNPVLADALMYFRAHNDGRGAALRDDDTAGLRAIYPDALHVTTPLAEVACRFDLGLLATACFGQPLPVALFTRFGKARGATARAATVPTTKKQRKLLRKALTHLKKAERLIARRVPGSCRDAMQARAAALRARATEVLATL